MKPETKPKLTKFEQYKQAIKNPPAERLHKINMQSHILNALGTLFVAGALIYKGYWYVVFAFIFSLGLSYTGYIQSKNQYNQIMQLKNYGKDITSEDYIIGQVENEISPLRKKTLKIKYLFGKKVSWIIMFACVVLVWWLVDPTNKDFWWRLATPIIIIFMYWFIYLQVLGRLAEYIWSQRYIKKDIKGGDWK